MYLYKYSYILPSYWFSLSAIDQYSSLLYIKALGFFQTQCGRSTFQLRLRFIARKVITFPTTHRDKNFHLKADFNLLFIRDFSPYFKVVNLSFTHLYTTTSHPLRCEVVRLACVKYLDSVQSEPSSNSKIFFWRYI